MTLPVEVNGAGGANHEVTLRVAELAEQLGYHFGTVPHHRFDPDVPSSPLVLLGALSARTSSLRLGTNIAILPLLHPLQVAEEIATVDRLSNGRVFLGAGVGYRRPGFEAGGITFERRGKRMTEALEILRLVLSEENVSFDGEEFRFEGVTIQPRPLQQPNPPVWVGAQLTKTVERAGRLADGWMTDSKATVPELARLASCFREAADRVGDGRGRSICVTRDVAIARDRRELEEVWFPEALRRYVSYWEMGVRWPDDKRLAERALAGERITLDEFAEDRFLVGTPDEIVEQVVSLRAAVGCDHLCLRPGYDEVFREDQLRMLAEHVLPAFAGQ